MARTLSSVTGWPVRARAAARTRRRLVEAAAAAFAGKFYFKAAEPKQRDLAAKRKNLASDPSFTLGALGRFRNPHKTWIWGCQNPKV